METESFSKSYNLLSLLFEQTLKIVGQTLVFGINDPRLCQTVSQTKTFGIRDYHKKLNPRKQVEK